MSAAGALTRRPTVSEFPWRPATPLELGFDMEVRTGRSGPQYDCFRLPVRSLAFGLTVSPNCRKRHRITRKYRMQHVKSSAFHRFEHAQRTAQECRSGAADAVHNGAPGYESVVTAAAWIIPRSDSTSFSHFMTSRIAGRRMPRLSRPISIAPRSSSCSQRVSVVSGGRGQSANSGFPVNLASKIGPHAFVTNGPTQVTTKIVA
jgi:hypothetical protein